MKLMDNIRFLPCLHWYFLKENFSRFHCDVIAVDLRMNLLLITFILMFFSRDEFNIQVLHAFVELHEFTDLNLVQALR